MTDVKVLYSLSVGDINAYPFLPCVGRSWQNSLKILRTATSSMGNVVSSVSSCCGDTVTVEEKTVTSG